MGGLLFDDEEDKPKPPPKKKSKTVRISEKKGKNLAKITADALPLPSELDPNQAPSYIAPLKLKVFINFFLLCLCVQNINSGDTMFGVISAVDNYNMQATVQLPNCLQGTVNITEVILCCGIL